MSQGQHPYPDERHQVEATTLRESRHTIATHGQQSERLLWMKRDLDPRAREELVERYLPFARNLASRYMNGRESFDDLVQVASVGLMNAVNRFDAGKGTPFTAFASPTIHGELKRYFRDRIWLVRVPRGLQEEIMAVDSAATELAARLHRNPTREELADHAGLDLEVIDRVSVARQERLPVSLEGDVTEEGESRSERIGNEDPGFDAVENADEMRFAMNKLGDTERLVMRLRFIDEMTQSEIAERIGCSQMHISRMLRKSVSVLADSTTPA